MDFIELIKSLVGKSDWDYAERRELLRVRCRIEATLQNQKGLMGAEILNISVEGMQLMCLAKVKTGSIVHLKGVKQYNQATHHDVACRVEWVKKQTPGYLAGVIFIDSPQQLSRSWLFWEMKERGLRTIASEQRRKEFRVRCLIPSQLVVAGERTAARVVNLSPTGAMIQTTGAPLQVGEGVRLTFGPIKDLPAIDVQSNVTSVHTEGAPVYGLRFNSFKTGGPKELKRYLDFFFKS